MSKENDNVIDIEITDSSESEKPDIKDSDISAGNEAVEGTQNSSETSVNKEDRSSGSVAAEYVDQLLRAQAELQNYKRRTEQRMQHWQTNNSRDLVIKLLPVVDDFDILFEHHKDEDETISIKGVTMIYNKLMSTLADLGLEPIEAAGQPFDPNLHEAVMAEESDDFDDGQIVKVWQRGFKFKDSLMRPAKVITAIAKRQSGDSNEQ